MQYVRKNIQLLPDQAEAIRILAFETRESESEHIRRALDAYLKNLKEETQMQSKYARLLEIAEETGEVPVATIDNLTETIAELKQLGYIAYLDASTDYLIVEKDA